MLNNNIEYYESPNFKVLCLPKFSQQIRHYKNICCQYQQYTNQKIQLHTNTLPYANYQLKMQKNNFILSFLFNFCTISIDYLFFFFILPTFFSFLKIPQCKKKTVTFITIVVVVFAMNLIYQYQFIVILMQIFTLSLLVAHKPKMKTASKQEQMPMHNQIQYILQVVTIDIHKTLIYLFLQLPKYLFNYHKTNYPSQQKK
eukprot:TRINITY_DN3438_c1_g1_i1.p1 TRINITY_DN3438_c1_g1~~TRINITY_DN3438_c1_g1_i1.p1  ORF type:complete len:200 (-),score=-22.69 TRINITY_DN3438_c1_g1_i1:240-839(-)